MKKYGAVNGAVFFMCQAHAFRMPLNTADRKLFMAKCFGNAIFGSLDDFQIYTNLADTLVVG